MRAAPLVIYPEAAQLAGAMLDFERAGSGMRRAVPDGSRTSEQLMVRWGVDVTEGRQALLVWLGRHRTGVPAPSRPADRCQLMLASGHDRIASRTGSVRERSCLIWQLGMAAADM